jgi:hypothetical protein
MYRNAKQGKQKMNTESNIEKLARLYKEEKFTKEQMAEEMFKNGADFPTVVRVGRAMGF